MDMSNFYTDLQTPYWWVSVIIVGIIVSIVGNVLTKIFASKIKCFKDWRDERAKADDKNFKKDLESLRSDPQQEKVLLHNEIRQRLFSLECLVHSIFLFFMFSILFFSNVPKWVSLVAIFLFVLTWLGYWSFSFLSRRSERLLNEFYSSNTLPDQKNEDTTP